MKKSILSVLKEALKKEHRIAPEDRKPSGNVIEKIKNPHGEVYAWSDIGRLLFRERAYALPGVYRNKKCTCGSGRKYKRCCYPAWPPDSKERRPENQL